MDTSTESLFYLKTDLESLIALEKILQKTLGNQADEDLYSKALIALTEALNNAILHGNKSDMRKIIRVSYSECSKYFTFKVSDEGEGFDYTSLPNPIDPDNLLKINGRGIFIMKNLADEVQFEDKGRTVVLKFSKTPCTQEGSFNFH
ncbi:MAG: ATP-binding protein [Flavobacteriales bacterium]|nr:ATP-binding protein [Flavobacteriales bacterium]